MKCVYRITVKGELRLLEKRPLNIRGFIYEFETEADGSVSHVKVTTSLNKEEWPQFVPAAAPGEVHALTFKNPQEMFMKIDLQSLETVLSIYGSPKIDLNTVEVKWIPENELEKSALRVTEFKRWIDDPFPVPPTPFDVIVRSIIASIELQNVSLPLSFYRQGSIAYAEQRYIEAIYQFYFLFETLFGNGKTRNRAIKAEFKQSALFRSAVEYFLTTAPDEFPSPKLAADLRNKFGTFNCDSLIDHIVDLRGFLHHHTSRRRNIWHPLRQIEYSLEALMFAQIALRIVVKLVFEHLENPQVMDQYYKIARSP